MGPEYESVEDKLVAFSCDTQQGTNGVPTARCLATCGRRLAIGWRNLHFFRPTNRDSRLLCCCLGYDNYEKKQRKQGWFGLVKCLPKTLLPHKYLNGCWFKLLSENRSWLRLDNDFLIGSENAKTKDNVQYKLLWWMLFYVKFTQRKKYIKWLL